MNIELLSSGGIGLPSFNQGIIEEGLATKVAFDPSGAFFSVGHHDGRILIWDFYSRNLSRVLFAHVRPITSLSWSPDSKKLLSTSTDRNLLLWDLTTGSIERRVTFESPIMWAGFNPNDPQWCVVARLYSNPFLYNFSTREQELLSTEERWSVPALALTKAAIYMGTRSGTIKKLNWQSLEVEEEVTVCDSQIRSIHFSRNEQRYAISTNDRNLRCFNLKHENISGDLQDPITVFQWKAAAFSPGEEYVLAGTSTEPVVGIWAMIEGSEIKEAVPLVQLEVPDGISDLDWHPSCPVALTASISGRIYIWSPPVAESFSRWDPHFRELESNQIYEEEENEFDIGFVPMQARRGYLTNEITDEPVEIDDSPAAPSVIIPIEVEPEQT